MSKVLISLSSFGEQDPGLAGLLETAGLHIVMNPFGRKLTEPEVSQLLQEHRPEGMIAGVEPLTRSVLERAASLKVISRCGIGLDSVDLEAARDLGIRVTNTPDAPTIPVAELTVGMILTMLRSIHRSDASIRSGGWERPMGRLLHGMTVGIVGCGRIGSQVARLLSPFGCNLIGHDPHRSSHPDFPLVSFEELLRTADLVTLHVPYAPENHHLLQARTIEIMKPGAFLVNAARGGLVDEVALSEALKAGRLGGAALDCFEAEPYAGPLVDCPTALLTAHIGSYAKEGRAIMERQAVDNLIRELGRGAQGKA